MTFVAHFLHVFYTNAPYLILYQLTKFQRHIFFTGYRTKCVINVGVGGVTLENNLFN